MYVCECVDILNMCVHVYACTLSVCVNILFEHVYLCTCMCVCVCVCVCVGV